VELEWSWSGVGVESSGVLWNLLESCGVHWNVWASVKSCPLLRLENDFIGPEIISIDTQLDHPDLLPRLSHIYPVKLYLSHLKGKRKDVYTFLATAQQTRFAVTPIHTTAEFKLFNKAVSFGGEHFTSHGQPDFGSMSRWWSKEADGKKIFYKLKEHLSTYYKTWTDSQQGRISMIATEKQRELNTRRIKSKSHTVTVLPAASRLHPGIQDSGSVSRSFEEMEVEQYESEVMPMEDVQSTSFEVLQRPYTAEQLQATSSVGPVDSVFHPIQSTSQVFISGPKKKPKTCGVCKSSDCSGKGNRKLCKRLAFMTVGFINQLKLVYKLIKSSEYTASLAAVVQKNHIS
jgi:hypothetical protein